MAQRRPTPVEFGLFACVPAIFTIVAIAIFHSIHQFAGDFHKEFWPAGLHILNGQTPYLLSHAQVANGIAFPYPALTGLVMAPFALLSRSVSEVLFTLICFAALFAILRVLGVRDWRLYGLVLLWAPVMNAWQSANLTLLLALGLALMWRYRDRPAVAGLCVAVVISLKPFVWPAGVWLLATRRWRATGHAILYGAVINGIAWAVLGFNQIGRYLHDASQVSGEFFRHAYTPIALLLHLGATTSVADGIGVVLAVAALIVCVWLGLRGRELAALTLAIVVMWLASPVLWMHYFALILVPLAIARPRLEPVWALPIVLIVCGSRSTQAWQIVLVLLVMSALVVAALKADGRPWKSLVRSQSGDEAEKTTPIPTAA